jgi:heme/copper-type cytochrome/quinol oxidase subunit 4
MPDNPPQASQGNLNSLSPGRALAAMRIMWLALLLGPILFMMVIILAILPHAQPPKNPVPAWKWVSFAVLLSVVPVAFVIRMFMHRGGRTEVGVRARAYAGGNIIFWAACEGCAILGLIVAMLNVSLWPTIVVTAIALSFQALTFPLATGIDFSDGAGFR